MCTEVLKSNSETNHLSKPHYYILHFQCTSQTKPEPHDTTAPCSDDNHILSSQQTRTEYSSLIRGTCNLKHVTKVAHTHMYPISHVGLVEPTLKIEANDNEQT